MYLSRLAAAALLLTPTLGSLYSRNVYEPLYVRVPNWAERDVPNVAPQILDLTSQTGDGRYTAKSNAMISARDLYGHNTRHSHDPENQLAYHKHHLGNGEGSTGLDMAPRHLDTESQSSGGAQHGNPALQVRSPHAEAYADAYLSSNEPHSGIYARMATRIPRLHPRSPGISSSRLDDRPRAGRSSGHGATMAGMHMYIPSNRNSPGPSRPDSPARQSPVTPFIGDALTINTLSNSHSPSRPRRHSRLNPDFPVDAFYQRPRPSKHDDIFKKALSHPDLQALALGPSQDRVDADDEGHSPGSPSHPTHPAHRLSGIGENEPYRRPARTNLRHRGGISEIEPYRSPLRTPGGRSRHSPVRSRLHTPVGTRYHSPIGSGTSGMSTPRTATNPFSEIPMGSGHSTPGRESHWSREGHASDEEEARKRRREQYEIEYKKHIQAQQAAEQQRLHGGELPKTPEEKAAEKERKAEERRRKGLTSTKPWVAGFIGAAGVAGLLGVGSSTAAVFVSEQATRASQKSTNAALAQVLIGQQQANASSAQVKVQQANVDQAIKQVKIQTADEQAQKTQAQAALAQVKIGQQNAQASTQQAKIQTQEEGIQVAQMKIAAQQAATALAVAQKTGANITQGIPLPGLPLSRRFNLPRKHLADKLVYYGSDKNLLLRDIAARMTAPMGLS